METTSRLAAAALVVASLACGCLGQERYGPYRGPPVVPVILPGGFLADTQEVAAAKNYHLNVLNQVATGAQAAPKGNSNHGYYNAKAYQPPPSAYQQPAGGRYQAQGRPGYKAQPQAQLYTKPAYQPVPQQYTKPLQQGLYQQKQVYRPAAPVQEADDYDDGQYRALVYTTPRPDPLVTPKILENGYIADTQEVDAAKAEHFAAVARAQEAVARANQEAAAKAAAVPRVAPPAPARGYDAPARGYDAPARGYDAPARGYDAPARGYDAPARGYDAPARGYDAQARGYDAPARGYDAADRGYDVPASGYDD